jgi:DNA-directed RNA polymerase specialized sigma24 family protein
MVTSVSRSIQLHSVPPASLNSIAEYFLDKLRPLAYRFTLKNSAYDIDEYVSMGIERVLQVVRKTGKTDKAYLYGVARMAMKQASLVAAEKYIPCISLDAYLYDEETDVAHHIEEDIITPTHPTTIDASLQQKVKLLLSVLPLKQKMVVLAYYGLEDENGGLWTRDAVCEWFGLTGKQFSDIRCQAVHRLTCIPM